MTVEITPEATTERKTYYYPPERTYTGLVQFRMDVEEEVDAGASGKWRRGEVKAIKNPDFAHRLVSGGKHAHAPAGTPIGQPEEFMPKAAAVATAAAPTATAPTEPQPSAASIPLLITSVQRLQLAKLGYTDAEIDAMNPQQAHDAIAKGKKE